MNYSTDKVILMVSAKALDINGVLDSRFWQWVAKDSGFDVAAEAKDVEWFEVWQNIESTILSPKTTYSVSFVLKVNKDIMKSCPTPFEFSLKPNGEKDSQLSSIYLGDWEKSVGGIKKTDLRNFERGWTEFVLGQFTTNGKGEMEIEVCMKNTDRSFHKRGITIDGVQITPID
ncbi:hypothetical protein E8P77_32440 [Soehngenia saccharolytica]|nr:hypothetical protein E8P77_32440 [Soehngenia saccharolytica]